MDAWEHVIRSLPEVREAARGCLPAGYECTVEGSAAEGAPSGVTVIVDRWPACAEVLSFTKLAAERRRVLLGQPALSERQFPLSEGAASLLQYLRDRVVEVLGREPGTEVVCETRFDERRLREERTKVLQSLKTSVQDK